MNYLDIIRNKRDGKPLSSAEINYLVQGISAGTLPEYQLSAWAMAVFFQGMNDTETKELAMAMAYSGDVADLSSIPGLKVDKHSTGGVGDKTTLIVIPIAAAAGVPAAKMSGRGLGHTGGTIDKFESIPGFQVEMNHQDFVRQVQEIGAAVVSQSGNLVPADKKLYALRDVTATIESIPLIASSVMSKKIASGADGIVLDVKVGQGAFMKEREEAVKLATTMVEIGKMAGRRVVAILSDMEQPLGRMVGNALEVQEAIDTLQGRGPSDLEELSVTLAAHMLLLGGRFTDINEASLFARRSLKDGSALAKFNQMVKRQGGNIDYQKDDYGLKQAGEAEKVIAAREGYISQLNAFEVGRTAMFLGAGRERIEDRIDHSAGIELRKKRGDRVCPGDTLAVLHTNAGERLPEAVCRINEAYTITDREPAYSPLLLEIIS